MIKEMDNEEIRRAVRRITPMGSEFPDNGLVLVWEKQDEHSRRHIIDAMIGSALSYHWSWNSRFCPQTYRRVWAARIESDMLPAYLDAVRPHATRIEVAR